MFGVSDASSARQESVFLRPRTALSPLPPPPLPPVCVGGGRSSVFARRVAADRLQRRVDGRDDASGCTSPGLGPKAPVLFRENRVICLWVQLITMDQLSQVAFKLGRQSKAELKKWNLNVNNKPPAGGVVVRPRPLVVVVVYLKVTFALQTCDLCVLVYCHRQEMWAIMFFVVLSSLLAKYLNT